MKPYHKKGMKNYWLFSKDGSIQQGIDKKLKKLSNRLTRKSLKEDLAKEVE